MAWERRPMTSWFSFGIRYSMEILQGGRRGSSKSRLAKLSSGESEVLVKPVSRKNWP